MPVAEDGGDFCDTHHATNNCTHPQPFQSNPNIIRCVYIYVNIPSQIHISFSISSIFAISFTFSILSQYYLQGKQCFAIVLAFASSLSKTPSESEAFLLSLFPFNTLILLLLLEDLKVPSSNPQLNSRVQASAMAESSHEASSTPDVHDLKSSHEGDSGNCVDSKPNDSYPDGGVRAWAVAIGTSGILCTTFGLANAFGYAFMPFCVS